MTYTPPWDETRLTSAREEFADFDLLHNLISQMLPVISSERLVVDAAGAKVRDVLTGDFPDVDPQLIGWLLVTLSRFLLEQTGGQAHPGVSNLLTLLYLTGRDLIDDPRFER